MKIINKYNNNNKKNSHNHNGSNFNGNNRNFRKSLWEMENNSILNENSFRKPIAHDTGELASSKVSIYYTFIYVLAQISKKRKQDRDMREHSGAHKRSSLRICGLSIRLLNILKNV